MKFDASNGLKEFRRVSHSSYQVVVHMSSSGKLRTQKVDHMFYLTISEEGPW